MAGKSGRNRPAITFREACEQLDDALSGTTRREILEQLDGPTETKPLARLRSAMRSHKFPTRSGAADLRRIVQTLDTRSRREGLHVIQGWDFQAHRFTDDISPVLLLDYCERLELPKASIGAACALLLDQYFLTVLSLLTIRAWDEGDPNANFDRVQSLLHALQGPSGSGHRAVDDAETLFLLAVSYYHPDERCYGVLLDKVVVLDEVHRLRVAIPCAPLMSAHLRWGLQFMYQRDIGRMRDDNVVDYPWLLFAVATLTQAFARSRGNATQLDALLAGLAADPWALEGARPSVLDASQSSHTQVLEWLHEQGNAFLADVAALQPSSASFTPLGFTCNFPSNAAVAKVAISLEDARAYPSLNALLSREPVGAAPSAEGLARRLAEYSVADPARLGAHNAPLIVYDPFEGVRAYNAVLRVAADRAR